MAVLILSKVKCGLGQAEVLGWQTSKASYCAGSGEAACYQRRRPLCNFFLGQERNVKKEESVFLLFSFCNFLGLSKRNNILEMFFLLAFLGTNSFRYERPPRRKQSQARPVT